MKIMTIVKMSVVKLVMIKLISMYCSYGKKNQINLK
jgi:hypothetical protein